MILPNIAADGKEVHVYSQCRKRNRFVNECAQMNSFESLYKPDGQKNSAHYYWRVQWVNTPTGPMALTLEDGYGKLYVTDLRTGRGAIALERTLGISNWDIVHHDDGAMGVKGQLGFEQQEVSNVAMALQQPDTASPDATAAEQPTTPPATTATTEQQ